MSQNNDTTARCIYYETDSAAIPLVAFKFQGNDLWICSQHLPILIHRPAQLAAKLPGAEKLSPSDHDH